MKSAHCLAAMLVAAIVSASTLDAQSSAPAQGQGGQGGQGQGQGRGSGSGARAGSVDAADQQFVMSAAEGGTKEVELGKLAQQRALDADVRAFGGRMVTDHSKANGELMSLAKTKNIAVKPNMNAHKSEVTRLSGLSGVAFDRAYVDAQVADHDKTVALFEKQAKGGSDPELKAWAEKTLPTLREHQKMAKDLQAKIGR